MEKTKKSLLNIKEVFKEYIVPREKFSFTKKRIIALDRVSLELKSGESFGIVGESGCGKSTLAKTIMGLEFPQSGEIFFLGQNLHTLKPLELRRIRKNLQMIFQDPYGSLNPRQNIEKIVSEPLTLLDGISFGEKKEKVRLVLEKVGLSPNDIIKYPHEFSGGQRQRIAIARSLITQPALIIADEPVSALDVSVQAQVLNLMMDLRDEHGLAYLFISHDLSIVRQMTSKIAVMYDGRIVETGYTENLFNNPKHPYTKALLQAIPKPDPISKIKRREKIFKSNQKTKNFLTKPSTGCKYANHCPNVEEKCRKISPSLKNINLKSNNRISKNFFNKNHKISCFNPLN